MPLEHRIQWLSDELKAEKGCRVYVTEFSPETNELLRLLIEKFSDKLIHLHFKFDDIFTKEHIRRLEETFQKEEFQIFQISKDKPNKFSDQLNFTLWVKKNHNINTIF